MLRVRAGSGQMAARLNQSQLFHLRRLNARQQLHLLRVHEPAQFCELL
jgi:hypothetical protein